MTILSSLAKILRFIFTGEEEAPVEHPPEDFKLKMSDAVFNVMTSSESPEMKARLRSDMEHFERQGIFSYTIYSDAWEYIINNGQFRANPIKPKGA